MVTASHGEIDACASFTVKQIIHYQKAAVTANGDNFFTGYTLRTLVGPVFNALGARALGAIINSLIQKDQNPRTPSGKRDQVMYK